MCSARYVLPHPNLPEIHNLLVLPQAMNWFRCWIQPQVPWVGWRARLLSAMRPTARNWRAASFMSLSVNFDACEEPRPSAGAAPGKYDGPDDLDGDDGNDGACPSGAPPSGNLTSRTSCSMTVGWGVITGGLKTATSDCETLSSSSGSGPSSSCLQQQKMLRNKLRRRLRLDGSGPWGFTTGGSFNEADGNFAIFFLWASDGGTMKPIPSYYGNQSKKRIFSDLRPPQKYLPVYSTIRLSILSSSSQTTRRCASSTSNLHIWK